MSGPESGSTDEGGRAPRQTAAAAEHRGPVWNARSLAAAFVFCGIALIQLGVPALRLGAGEPARFGWQMFSRVNLPATIAVEHGGVTDTIAWPDYFARARPEIDVPAVLPPHLCRLIPAAERVTVSRAGTHREYPCP